MDCKCRITCVKVWMCLAVFGCIMTLILAGIVLSSYSFETVIGPLPCKLRNIAISNCCYDNSCIYGKQYTYYFSSNSSHCMNKYDIYNHPFNKTVRFRDTTSCYPSLKSLHESTPKWRINESIIFYVNRDCTEWTESSKHHSSIRRNLIWISIILTFVGCSCISMICGFITMYNTEILICLIDYCNCNYCNKYIIDDDDNNNYNCNDIQNNINRSSISNSNSTNIEINNNDQYNKIYNQKHARNKSHEPPPPIHTHLSVEYATKHHQLYSKPASQEYNLNASKINHRPRGQSNASKISKLSPLSDANDDNIIRQFVVENGMNLNNKIKIRERQLKNKIYSNDSSENENENENENEMDVHMTDINGYNVNHITDKHINDIIDDIASNGFSASVEFENEWYDENGSKYTGMSTNDGSSLRNISNNNNNNILITRNRNRNRNKNRNKNIQRYSNDDEYQDEEEEDYTIDDDHFHD